MVFPYVATASPSYPFDLAEKIEKAKKAKGPAYIHMYACCPTGWRMAPELAVSIGRLAVQTGVFPLYEIERGKLRHDHAHADSCVRFRITSSPRDASATCTEDQIAKSRPRGGRIP